MNDIMLALLGGTLVLAAIAAACGGPREPRYFWQRGHPRFPAYRALLIPVWGVNALLWEPQMGGIYLAISLFGVWGNLCYAIGYWE